MKHKKMKTLLHTGRKSAKQILTNKGFSQQNFFVFDCYLLQYLVSVNFKFQRTLQNFVHCWLWHALLSGSLSCWSSQTANKTCLNSLISPSVTGQMGLCFYKCSSLSECLILLIIAGFLLNSIGDFLLQCNHRIWMHDTRANIQLSALQTLFFTTVVFMP